MTVAFRVGLLGCVPGTRCSGVVQTANISSISVHVLALVIIVIVRVKILVVLVLLHVCSTHSSSSTHNKL